MNLKAIFPTGITELTVNGLHQWDYGRKLEIHATDLPALVEVHFACPGMEEAIVRVGSAVGGVVTVAIPDRCLEQYAPITAWVYEVGETYGQTIKALTLNIMKRARPQVSETLTPEICDKYTEAVGAMNGVVDDLKSGKTAVKKATEADHATEAGKANVANHTKVWVVSSLSGLLQMIQTNPSSSIGINIIADGGETGIKIPTTTGDVYIPNNADGTLTIGVGSASMHLTTYTGEVYHLFYKGNRDTWVKGLIEAHRATYASHSDYSECLETDAMPKYDYNNITKDGLYCVVIKGIDLNGESDRLWTNMLIYVIGSQKSMAKDPLTGYVLTYENNAFTLLDSNLNISGSIYYCYRMMGPEATEG